MRLGDLGLVSLRPACLRLRIVVSLRSLLLLLLIKLGGICCSLREKEEKMIRDRFQFPSSVGFVFLFIPSSRSFSFFYDLP